MRSSKERLAAVVCCLVMWKSVALGEPTVKAAKTQQEITWALVGHACPTSPAHTLSCGNVGKYDFGGNTPSSCTLRATATETPATYGAGQAMEDIFQIEPGGGSPLPWPGLRRLKAGVAKAGNEPPVTQEQQLPCDLSKITTPPGGPSGSAAWLAAADWGNEHGTAVAAAMAYTSNMPVHLLELDDPQMTQLLGETVGDAHLLAALCRLLEAIESDGTLPPETLNMSFGRLFDPDKDPIDSSCHRNALSCQVVKLLHRLEHRHSVTAVAAAGNHLVEQFPAAVSDVISVGSLDLTAFTASQVAVSSWETPDGVQARFPGSALCLHCPDGEGQSVPWRPRPGSSFASATFAGSLGAVLVDLGTGIDPLTQEWSPRWSSFRGCFDLGPNLQMPCNHAVNRIFAQIFGVGEASCWSHGPRAPNLALTVPGSPEDTNPLLPVLSHLEWTQKHSPAPPPDICGACIDDPAYKSARLGPARNELTLSLLGAALLPPTDQLEVLILRIGGDFYRLLDATRGEDVAPLAGIEQGLFARLTLLELPELPENEQMSLITITSQENQEPRWNSTPLSILPRSFPAASAPPESR